MSIKRVDHICPDLIQACGLEPEVMDQCENFRCAGCRRAIVGTPSAIDAARALAEQEGAVFRLVCDKCIGNGPRPGDMN